MTHPHRAEVSSHVKERLARFRGMSGQHEDAGERAVAAKAVHAHERNLHAGEKETKLHLASGGRATKRLDRAERRRGGSAKGKGKTQVNVIVAGHGAPPPTSPPVMAHPMPAPPAPGMGPPGMGAPPGAGGIPPQVLAAMAGQPHKRGGRAGRANGGAAMTAGAGSGEGREQKAAKAKKSP